MSDQKRLNRRDFLKGAATAGAGLAAVGALGACSPTPVPATAVPPTAVPPTKVPPTAVPPTAVPPTAVPPTAVPTKAPVPVVPAYLPAKWDYEADVVVLGTGYAGQVTAIIAHDAGATVLMLEKASEKNQGGNSKVSGQGIWCPTEGVKEDAFKYLQAMTTGTGYPVPDEYLRYYVQGSYENKAWLQGLGAQLKPRGWDSAAGSDTGTWVPFYVEMPGAAAMAKEPSSYLISPEKGWGSGWFFLEDRVLERKNIKKMYETPGKRLIQDPVTKEILGVVAESGGKEIFVKAKRAVAMCCGGYEYNQQMIRDYIHIQDYTSTGTPYNTGDGIKMCMAVGADLINMGVYAAPWGVRTRVPEYKSVVSFSSPTVGGLIWVGADSKRYKNEFWAMPTGPWPNHRPTFCGSVFENGAYRREKTPFPIHAIFDEKARLSRALWGGAWSVRIEGYVATADNSAEIAKGWAKKANTIRELATLVGRDPAVLEATVNKWNADCAAGKDAEFARTGTLTPIAVAPFYAVNLVPGTLNTQGGMLRNIKGQVLDKEGKPIPRLYAAGEIGDRVWANLYECMKNVGAGCMASGRDTGKNAAAEKPWA
jgi:succinate dehydrogenase/fumarate reductase flavoprotein subunit